MNVILGMKWGPSLDNGACNINLVVSGGPLARAGALAGDLVETIDGEPAQERRRRWANGTCPREVGLAMLWQIQRESEDGEWDRLTLTVAFGEAQEAPDRAFNTAPALDETESPPPVFTPPAGAAISLRSSPISIANGSAPPPAVSPLLASAVTPYLTQAQRQAYNQRYAYFRQRGMSAAEAEQIAARPMSDDERLAVVMDRCGVRASGHEYEYVYNSCPPSLR
jgi:hypothetical protein